VQLKCFMIWAEYHLLKLLMPRQLYSTCALAQAEDLFVFICVSSVFFFSTAYVLYTVNRKKRGSTFVIITLEKHTRFS